MKKQEITKTIDLEKAKQLLEESNKQKVSLAAEDLNNLLENWKKKHDCDIIISGQFQGSQIQTGLQVIINNK